MATVKLCGFDEELSVGKIICIGANYGRHIEEMGRKKPDKADPMLFFKPPTAIVRDRGKIKYPDFSTELHHELEMVLLVGKTGVAIPVDRALDHLLGVGVGIDLTARDIQREVMKKGFPWAVCKGFDDSAPVSDFILLQPGIDPDNLDISLRVNGDIRQRANTSDMLIDAAGLVSAASRYFRLERGDLLFTGTPEGVGTLERGDTLEAELEGLVKASFEIED